MVFLFWDASGLAKRYTNETGREIANTLFETLPDLQHGSTAWGYAETYAILLRRLNGGALKEQDFTIATTALQEEVVESGSFLFFTIEHDAPFRSLAMIRKHNLNSTDAILLTTLLHYARSEGTLPCVVVAADKRLLRAAEAEGLPVINPETASVADVTTMLAAL